MQRVLRCSAVAGAGRRWVLSTPDPVAMGGGASMGERVRESIDLHRNVGFDPDNMGCVLGGDDVGTGTDCAHLDGPKQELKEHKKIGNALDQLFPIGQAPPENAMAIATAPTAQELAAQDAHEALREAVRDKYRQACRAKEAEQQRVEEADRRLQSAIDGNQSITSMMSSLPPTPPPPRSRSILDELEAGGQGYDQVESFGDAVSSLLKKGADAQEGDIAKVVQSAKDLGGPAGTAAPAAKPVVAAPPSAAAQPTPPAPLAQRSAAAGALPQKVQVLRQELLDLVDLATSTTSQLAHTPQAAAPAAAAAAPKPSGSGVPKLSAQPTPSGGKKPKMSMRERLRLHEEETMQAAPAQAPSGAPLSREAQLERRVLQLELDNSVLHIAAKLRDLQALAAASSA